MRILLTGATGLVGRHTLDALLRRGVEVCAVARSNPVQAGFAPTPQVAWRRCDLLNPLAVRALVQEMRPSHLIHAAWVMEPGAVWRHPANLSWIGATLGLAEQFVQGGGRRFIGIGTCAEYAWIGDRCTEETTPLVAASLYGDAKNAARSALEAYAREVGLSLCWARLFNLYGPYEDPRRLIAGAADALIAGRPFASTDGRQQRDFLHVADAGEAIVELALSEAAGAVNVASGDDVIIADLLRTLARLANREDLLHLGAMPRPSGDPDRLLADVTRLRTLISVRPRFDLESGLVDTLDWRRRRGAG